jgi:pimeloyl-ACP methyl ester carboxylesterase
MKTTIKNTTTNYQKIGTGYPLILLHGWGCDWQIWSTVIGDLSDHFQLIIPDLPLFGESDTNGQVWDSFQYAQWLEAFIEDVIPGVPHMIAGHSFGGKIGAVYAAEYKPELLQGLIIIDASGLPEKLTTKEEVTQTVAQLIPQPIKKMIGKKVKQKVLSGMNVATDYQQASDLQQEVLKKIVREDISRQLSQLDVPALVTWGKNDDTTPLEKGELFAELIEGSQLVVFEQSGHYPFIDESKLFAATIIDFIQKHKK